MRYKQVLTLQQTAENFVHAYSQWADDGLCHKQVLTLQQTAENLVHAYPHIGSMEVMLEVLADQRGEPSKEQLVEYAQTNPMEAEWKRLIRYHNLLGTGMFPEYLPVSTCHLERREAVGVTQY